MADLLLELFSEEIPARMQARAGADLDWLMTKALEEAGYEGFAHRALYGPRRLTYVASGLPARQADSSEERKGPRVGAPEKAVQGFLRGAGLDDVGQAETREDKKGAFYVAVIRREGRATAEVVAEAVPALVRAFPWPKSMRWGGVDAKLGWVRPLRRVLCTLDGAVVPFTVENGGYGVVSGDVTEGHRFMAPGEVEAPDWAAYQARLREAHVVLDADERRERIAQGARALCEAEGLALVEDDALLVETAGLAEWPVPRLGTFDERFLTLPDEVLTASMRGHQKYFSVRDPATGRLAPRFVTVANVEPEDGGAAMMTGYERVLTARLSDGLFLFEQDLKKTLAEHAEKLSGVTFFEGLGTIADKVERVAALAREIAPEVGADPDLAEKAARLSKADLVTEMVGEFPELQGVMGRYYALEEGLEPEVADAIRDHYTPQGQADAVPTAPVSVAVALADKLATLAMFWSIGKTPTGSSDPFALRRMALGVVQIVLENELRLPVGGLAQCVVLPILTKDFYGDGRLDDQLAALPKIVIKGVSLANGELLEDPEKFDQAAEYIDHLMTIEVFGRTAASNLTKSAGVTRSLLAFFHDRLTQYLRDQGHRHDRIAAALAPGEDDLARAVALFRALDAFLGTPDGADLTAAYKRASNILRAEAKKGDLPDGAVDPALLAEPAERALHDELSAVLARTGAALADEDFQGAMSALADLRGPLDAFFEDVTVNAEDEALRANRLRLLGEIKRVCERVADLSKLEG